MARLGRMTFLLPRVHRRHRRARSGAAQALHSLPPLRARIIRRIDGPEQRRGALAMADQGVASLGNFLTSLLLARSLAQQDFGAFGLILEAILFFNAIHGALVTYPLCVRGAVAGSAALGRLATAALALTFAFGGIVAGATVLVGAFGGQLMLALAASAALLAWQVQETLRRAMLAHLRYRQVIWGDAVSYLGQGAVIAMLVWGDAVALERAFWVIALTSTAGAIIQLLQLRPRRVPLRDVLARGREFLSYGRFQALSSATIIVTAMGYSWALAWFHGTAAVAELYALILMLKLTNPLLIAIGGLIITTSAKALHDEGGLESSWRIARRYAWLGGLVLAPYFAVLLLFPIGSIKLVHGAASPYTQHDVLLRLLVVAAALTYGTNALSAFLSGIHHSRLSLRAQMMHVMVSLLLGIPLMIAFGAVAGTLGLSLAIAAQFAMLLRSLALLRRRRRRRRRCATRAPAPPPVPGPNTREINLAAILPPPPRRPHPIYVRDTRITAATTSETGARD
jgi:O-antigen/teichoic acid export membrane protein